jgi:predicted transcriptional regulator
MLDRDMSSAAEKAVEAIELLPEEMREPAAAYLLSQAKKFRALKNAIDEGMADVEAGRVVPWDLEDFLELTRTQVQP